MGRVAMIDPLEKAVECEHALRICPDNPDRMALLRALRDLWVTLARAKAGGMSGWQAQADNADRMHMELLNPPLH
jgi:hypothetical protein